MRREWWDLQDWLFKPVTARQRSGIEDLPLLRRLWVKGAVWGVWVMGCLVVRPFVPVGSWLGLVVGVSLGWAIGQSWFQSARRALAYRGGWLDGRQAMVDSLFEATQRGFTPSKWLMSELERDTAVLSTGPLGIRKPVTRRGIQDEELFGDWSS